MKKLEDIPKKDLFEAPEGYFDRLPGVIQARVAESASGSSWLTYFKGSVKYALPAIVIGVASVLYFTKPEVESAESLLASIDSEQLVAYLAETDVTAEDLIENVELDDAEASIIQEKSVTEINLDEIDIESLSNEFGVDEL